MSYSTINQSANDIALIGRLTAAAAQEGDETPETTAYNVLRWPVATASDIEAAYESAVIAENPNPGGDPTVITDGMILAKVQSILVPGD